MSGASDREGRGLHRAYVLHRRNHGETSLLVEVFALGLGRFPAISKGARRGRGGAGPLLQPFQPLWLGVVGRGEVRTLTGAEGAGRALELAGMALPCGFYLNELLMRLLARSDPHDALFGLYHAALAELADGAALHATLRRFELALLEELGYAPMLDTCEDGQPVQPGGRYRVESGQSPHRVAPGCPGDTVSGETLLALAAGRPLAAGEQREARALLRGLLAPHLGPKPLASRELLRQWQGTARNRTPSGNPSPSGVPR